MGMGSLWISVLP